MTVRRQILGSAIFLFLVFTLTASVANAKGGGEYKQIVSHLKTKYRAKKVKIPFMWLARFAVSVVRPAGVKSFSVTLFEDLKFSRETLDEEMQAAMRGSFGPEWSSILRVRSQTGEQVYMYMREAGKDSVRISLVTINKENAAVIRATINPDKLAEFMDNPKIFGISLDDNEKTAADKNPEAKPESKEADKDDDKDDDQDDDKENQ
jgi:hypothetical protein